MTGQDQAKSPINSVYSIDVIEGLGLGTLALRSSLQGPTSITGTWRAGTTPWHAWVRGFWRFGYLEMSVSHANRAVTDTNCRGSRSEMEGNEADGGAAMLVDVCETLWLARGTC